MGAEFKSDLANRIDTLLKKKQQLETERSMLTRQLTELKNEVKEKGYDPEKLAEEIKKLSDYITEFEAKATPVVEKLEARLGTVENEKFSSSDNQF
jgi:peptidoglycan hydrolase CwlO-like protein